MSAAKSIIRWERRGRTATREGRRGDGKVGLANRIVIMMEDLDHVDHIDRQDSFMI